MFVHVLYAGFIKSNIYPTILRESRVVNFAQRLYITSKQVSCIDNMDKKKSDARYFFLLLLLLNAVDAAAAVFPQFFCSIFIKKKIHSIEWIQSWFSDFIYSLTPFLRWNCDSGATR